MLVTFRSTATETITMFEDVAVSCSEADGRDRAHPRRARPGRRARALRRLEHATEQIKTGTHVTPARRRTTKTRKNEDEDDEDREPAGGPGDPRRAAVEHPRSAPRPPKPNVSWEGKGK